MNFSMQNSTSNETLDIPENDCFLPMAHGIAMITTNSLVGVLGTLGNFLVCLAIVTNPRLRRSSNYLLFSLAIADLIVTMVCVPLVVGILGKITFFYDCAENLERPYQIISRLSCTASVIHMAAISVDRFIAVVYPLHYKSIVQGCGLKVLLITSWTLPFTVPILNAAIPADFPKGFLGVSLFGLGYGTVFVSYAMIVVSLVKHRKERIQLRAHPSGELSQSSVEARVAFTLAIVIIVFTVSWFPLVTVFFATGKLLVKRQGIAFMWIRTLALSNSAMNFVIYGSRMKNFRESYFVFGRKILGALKPKCSRTRVYDLTNIS